jgi:hypothetical protein
MIEMAWKGKREGNASCFELMIVGIRDRPGTKKCNGIS